MKNIKLLLVSLFFITIVHSQTIHINEPEFDNNIIYANDTVGNGIPLEKIESEGKTSGTFKSLINRKVTGIEYVKNCCSTVRILQKSNLNFLVPYFTRQDPFEYIKVFKLTKEKKSRTVSTVQVKMKVFGSSDAEAIDTGYIKFTYKKYGERSYLITIDNLDSGEYAVTISTGKFGTFYLFGID